MRWLNSWQVEVRPRAHCAGMTRTSWCEGHREIRKTKGRNTAKGARGGVGGGDESVDTEIIALCSCEVRSRSGATSPPLSTFFPSLFVLQPPPLFSLSFESPANSVRVCCMLPWLFLEPDALCYLPVRPTNSGCRLCVLLDVWAGLFYVHMSATESDE